jgi:2,4-dienoyl-CoA reductase (NADPH2)
MSSATQFSRLLEPLQIKKVRLKNRIVKPGQRLGFADDHGNVTQQGIDFYENLAKGGAGLIIVDHAYVDFPMGAKARQASAADDAHIGSLAKLAEAIHRHGCPVFLQISHVGPDHDTKVSGKAPLTPSVLTREEIDAMFPGRGDYPPYRAITVPEIEALIAKFADGAERVRKAGFDGVEVHGAHAYLLATFFSRVWNRRDDRYGSRDIESRARIGVDILKAIRQKVGEDFVVGMRINGGEYGLDLCTPAAEAAELAQRMQAAGADYINVSCVGYGAYHGMQTPELVFYPEPPSPFSPELRASTRGTLIPLAAGIKKAVSIPVFAVGRLNPELGERVLAQNMADAICMGRGLLADPEMPKKLAEGRREDVAPCTACLTCWDTSRRGETTCRINAALGRESEFELKPAQRRKRVIVVGGGPAGMEAARVAALRGHDVTLYEKEPKLGGLLPLAALIKGTEVEDIPAIAGYLERQVRKLGVTVIVGTAFTTALAVKLKPDAIVLANGSLPATPDIKGIRRGNVLTTTALHRRSKIFLKFFGPNLLSVLSRIWLPMGRNVVIVGGLIYGCETAEFLVKRGRRVTIVEESAELGTGMVEVHRRRLLAWLAKKDTALHAGVKFEEITGDGLVISRNGEKELLKADTIVVALPPRPNDELVQELERLVPEVHRIGDGKEPRLIVNAIGDGAKVGRML